MISPLRPGYESPNREELAGHIKFAYNKKRMFCFYLFLPYLYFNALLPNSTARLRHLFFVHPFSFTIG